MKVLNVIASLDKSAGGPSRSVPQTCGHVSGLGVSVEIVARPSRNPVQVATTAAFQVNFLSLIKLVLFGLKLSKKEYSLVHLQHIWDPYIHVVARFSRLSQIPYLISPRGMLEPWIMKRHRLKKQLAMSVYQRRDLKEAACIHVTSLMEKASVRELGFANPVALIPNGIDLERVSTAKDTFEKNRVVFLSRIHEKKGIELLVEAWGKLDTEGWELEIAGEGAYSYLNKLKAEITKGRKQNIRLVGAKYGNDKWEFLKSADLMVLPTYSENFGNVVAEALAVGVPVITTTGTPWAELNTTRSGWCIAPEVQQLTKTLKLAMSLPPEELKFMGQNGRKLIAEKYDIKQIAKQIKGMYEWIEGRIEKPDFVYLD